MVTIEELQSARPDNQINLCDSCDYSYPDCPSKNGDVIFGNNIGNDNICACNKYKPSAQPATNCSEFPNNSDTISRQAAIDAVYDAFCYAYCDNCEKEMNEDLCGDCHRKYQNWSASKKIIEKVINNLPSAQPDLGKYEYHYDHTDCIWYRSEPRNRCPATCAQYRDGWNDAMNYIFRDGEGYRPFRRDKKYEG